MKTYNLIRFLLSVIICELAGTIGAIFMTPSVMDWYETLNKSNFNPPNWVFGPVWTILFLLMGISFYLVWSRKFAVKNLLKTKKIKAWNQWSQKLWTGQWRKANVILIFCLQLVLNILWTVIFFALRQPGIAFFEIFMLWMAIIYVIINFYRISKVAGYLFLPYLAWVSFAAFLNYSVWILNI